MGVYIKGMEMPKDKAIAVVIHPDGTAYTAEMVAGTCTEYLADCAAVSVPPHGRLIDVDALVERIDGIRDCSDMIFKPNDKICKIPEDCKGCKWAQTKDCIQRMVENAPTIIPAEEET